MASKLSNLSMASFVKKISTFFSYYYQSVIILIFASVVLYGLYIGYSLTYTTVFTQEPIDPSIIKSQQEKINLQRYEETSKNLEEKQTGNLKPSNIPPLFND